jgi:Protein of unknown function (DUF1572)
MTMSADWIATLFTRELDSFERELLLFPDEAAVWRTVPGVTNSAGTLALHVSGNLLHFIGAVLGSSGYVRDRSREFSARDISRASLIAEIDSARTVIARVMPRLTDDDLSQPFPEEIAGARIATGLFLTHLSAHLAFHLGQAGYLRRMLSGDPRSSSPLPLTVLASRA